jgi:HAD superfamily hydrolase (TIGR01450 family)
MMHGMAEVEMKRVGIKAILLDMDGVLFHGDRVLPGASDLLAGINAVPHCFVTNNPIRSPAEIVAHFGRIGLPKPPISRIVTSALATAQWLAECQPGFRYFAIGDQGLHEALAEHGVADPVGADFVVVGEGPGLDFDSLTLGINLLLDGQARLVCTNPDTSVDATRDGRHIVLPGGGALVAPFVAATGIEPVFVGKPFPRLFEMAMQRLGVDPAGCVMIGDRPDTDIAGAQALGMQTALVRTGRFSAGSQLPEGIRPDWDVTDLRDLLENWSSNGSVIGLEYAK